MTTLTTDPYALRPGEHLAGATDAFAIVLRRALMATKAAASDSYLSRGGVPRTKTRGDRQRDAIRLDALIDVLDAAFKWHGPWGQTRHAIKIELYARLAAKDGAK